MKKILLLSFLALVIAPSARAASCTSGYVLSPIDLQTYNVDGSPCDVVESSGPPSNADSGSFGGTGTSYRTSAAPAQSSQFVPLAPIPGLTKGVVANSAGLAQFLNNLYKYLVGLAAIIAVIEIIWGGIEISTKDSIPLKMKGKGRVYQALIGLVLVLSPVVVFSIINPSILNLSVSIPPLNTKPGAASEAAKGFSSGSGGGTASANACPEGCTCTGGKLLDKATCQTEAQAKEFIAACKKGSSRIPWTPLSSGYTGLCETNPPASSISTRYIFVDTSSDSGLLGYVNAIIGYSKYQPLESTPTNSKNGQQVVEFAKTCEAEGGTTCMSATKFPVPLEACTYGTGATGRDVSYCWAINLSCTDGKTGAGGCSSSPGFTPIK